MEERVEARPLSTEMPTWAASEAVDWPGVSVVMCVRNEARHLRAAVHAILAQDYPGPIEVVAEYRPEG